MSTHTLNFSTSQVTGLTTTQVAGMTCVQISSSLSAADLATINQAMIDDNKIINLNLGPAATTLQQGIVFTATGTKATATLTSATLVSPSTASLSAIQPGMYVAGVGLRGARVLSVSGTTITLDRNSISTPSTAQNQVYVATQGPMNAKFESGLLTFPNGRGVLQVLPGDYIAVDILGFPYLIPSTSINFNGGSTGSGAPFIFT